MKIKYLILIIFCLSFFTSFMAIVIPKCKAQQAYPNVTYDEYGWTSDMKKLSMTTPDIGLTFKITVYDNSSEPFDSASVNLYIYIYVYSNVIINGATQSNNILSKTYTFDSINELYLPSGQSSFFFVNVKNSNLYTSLAVGSYTADLYYSNYPLNYGAVGTPMGQYPFNFQVETPQVLQQQIAQNRPPSSLEFLLLAFGIMIVLAVVVSVVTTLVIATKTDFLNKRKKKFQFFGSLATILTVVFAGISLALQMIRW